MAKENRADHIITVRVSAEMRAYVSEAAAKEGCVRDAEFMRKLIMDHKRNSEYQDARS